MAHWQSVAGLVKKVDLQIWISAAIIGFANFIPYPAWQGLVSLVSVFIAHLLAKWINDRHSARQRKKFNTLLEEEIDFIEHLLPSAPEPRRSQLQKHLIDYRKLLSENSNDMFEF